MRIFLCLRHLFTFLIFITKSTFDEHLKKNTKKIKKLKQNSEINCTAVFFYFYINSKNISIKMKKIIIDF